MRSIATIAVAITFLAIYGSWQLFLAVISVVPPLISMVVIAKKLGGEKNNKGQSLKSKGKAGKEDAEEAADRSAGNLIGEVVRSARTVAAFSLEQRFYERFCVQAEIVSAAKKRQVGAARPCRRAAVPPSGEYRASYRNLHHASALSLHAPCSLAPSRPPAHPSLPRPSRHPRSFRRSSAPS